MSAIRSVALLAGMAFCSIAVAQDAFLMFSREIEKDGKKQYVSETRIAKCSPLKEANQVRCVLSRPKPEEFKPYNTTQLPEPVTFIHFGNPCYCKVDSYGRLICTPPGCR